MGTLHWCDTTQVTVQVTLTRDKTTTLGSRVVFFSSPDRPRVPKQLQSPLISFYPLPLPFSFPSLSHFPWFWKQYLGPRSSWSIHRDTCRKLERHGVKGGDIQPLYYHILLGLGLVTYFPSVRVLTTVINLDSWRIASTITLKDWSSFICRKPVDTPQIQIPQVRTFPTPFVFGK